MARGFDQAAVAALRAAARHDGAVSTGRIVGPQHGSATLAVGESVNIDGRVRAHVYRGGILHRRVVALIAAADQHRTAAGVARGIDARTKQANVMGGRRDAAASLSRALAGNIQRAADVHCAVFHAAQQLDGAVVVLNGLRLDHASVVDRVGEQASHRLRGHQHIAAVGFDQAAVFHQRIDRPLIDRHVQQLVACHVERDGVACCQCNRAKLGRNHTLVADVRAQQGHIATVADADRSLINDRARAGAGKLVVARHEVGIGDVHGGSHQATHIDRCALPKQDAVGVDEEHLAVGRQVAQDVGRIGANDAVERHRTAAGLHELHGLAGLNAEALPVDGHVRRGLVNRHVGWRAANGGAAR